MTDTVSHMAPERASADNRRAVPNLTELSTTRLLRHAHAASGGDLCKAFDVLRALAFDYPNARNATRVLRSKIEKHPGCDVFEIDRTGFVRLSKSAAFPPETA